ncbi:MAG: hypothetical protein JWR13_1701 [Mycobacterium sp.]|nr:hypothetical protein [Mycobacterium sp.]
MTVGDSVLGVIRRSDVHAMTPTMTAISNNGQELVFLDRGAVIDGDGMTS